VYRVLVDDQPKALPEKTTTHHPHDDEHQAPALEE
jgi:hypothetical protein